MSEQILLCPHCLTFMFDPDQIDEYPKLTFHSMCKLHVIPKLFWCDLSVKTGLIHEFDDK
jgi:hypothetical protein